MALERVALRVTLGGQRKAVKLELVQRFAQRTAEFLLHPVSRKHSPAGLDVQRPLKFSRRVLYPYLYTRDWQPVGPGDGKLGGQRLDIAFNLAGGRQRRWQPGDGVQQVCRNRVFADLHAGSEVERKLQLPFDLQFAAGAVRLELVQGEPEIAVPQAVADGAVDADNLAPGENLYRLHLQLSRGDRERQAQVEPLSWSSLGWRPRLQMHFHALDPR